MNKKVLVITLVSIAMMISGVAYLLRSNGAQRAAEQMIEKEQTGTIAPSTPSEKPVNSTAATGSYIDYSDGIVAKTSGTKLLFFHAQWCPQCRALEADIKKQGVPSGLTIIKVDYDTNQSLRQQYGVTLQTTFVKVDDNGKLVEKFVAYDDPTLKAVTTKLLP